MKKTEAKGKKLPIGEEEIKKAVDTLKKYKDQKRNFDNRVIENEQWWKMRHWDYTRQKEESVEPASAWLFNSIMNKLADFSDNAPEPNIRARMEDDVEEAQRLKHLLPMIFEANDFEQTYMHTSLSKIKNGVSFTGVFWNPAKENGLGDIEIKAINPLSIIYQPGITDIQQSRNVFITDLVDNEVLKELYPNIELKSGDDIPLGKYIYEDYLDTSEKTPVIEWYYKKNGKLQYCKFINHTVLESSENEPEKYPNGWYDDGEYPFVCDVLFEMEGSITGYGYIDVGKSPQEYIDKLDQAILKNALMSAQPRYFERNDSSINRSEFLDWTNPIVKTNGNLGQEDLRMIEVKPIPSFVLNARENKVQELKQTSGNSDVSTGSASGGVTAASAISQLIETGAKGSRHAIKGTYRAYRKIVYMIIERIRQFYDIPRCVRILGEDGSEEFQQYDNAKLKIQTLKGVDGEDYFRKPMFDIEVTAQKSTPYNKLSQNELALQFYQYGFFAPQNADATLACLKMMDFDHKQDVIKMVNENGTMYDIIQQLQQQNQKLSVLCDLYVPGSNLSGSNTAYENGNVGTQQSVSAPTKDNNETATQADKYREKAADATEV